MSSENSSTSELQSHYDALAFQHKRLYEAYDEMKHERDELQLEVNELTEQVSRLCDMLGIPSDFDPSVQYARGGSAC